ncbi:hypothetical protein D8676_02735 [Mesorhizobium sp. YM1C-6-2]|nr:hypothetical protein D8676_02735 [Mesorhizobium sp. YM1C-6-2]
MAARGGARPGTTAAQLEAHPITACTAVGGVAIAEGPVAIQDDGRALRVVHDVEEIKAIVRVSPGAIAAQDIARAGGGDLETVRVVAIQILVVMRVVVQQQVVRTGAVQHDALALPLRIPSIVVNVQLLDLVVMRAALDHEATLRAVLDLEALDVVPRYTRHVDDIAALHRGSV